MRLLSRATATGVAALMTATLTSVVAPTTAGAAGECSAPRYATGVCGVTFGKTQVEKPGYVRFKSDPVFKTSELVDGYLACRRDFTRTEGPYVANDHHRAKGRLHIGRHVPKGICTLTLVGRQSGHVARGAFKVVNNVS